MPMEHVRNRGGARRIGADQVALDNVAGGAALRQRRHAELLPEMTLPAPATVPPIVLFGGALEIVTPALVLGSAAVPAAFRPM